MGNNGSSDRLFFLTPKSLQMVTAAMKLYLQKETQVRSLGQEDPPEKEMATQSSILAWEITWTEEPG